MLAGCTCSTAAPCLAHKEQFVLWARIAHPDWLEDAKFSGWAATVIEDVRVERAQQRLSALKAANSSLASLYHIDGTTRWKNSWAKKDFDIIWALEEEIAASITSDK